MIAEKPQLFREQIYSSTMIEIYFNIYTIMYAYDALKIREIRNWHVCESCHVFTYYYLYLFYRTSSPRLLSSTWKHKTLEF